MQATIRKEFKFEAAHQLVGHSGKCANLHGHSYRVEVFVTGEVTENEGASDDGMVVDFETLDNAWEWIFDLLDHKNLNDVLPVRTTAENIAAWICANFNSWDGVLYVKKVRVWETAKCYAEVREEHISIDFDRNAKTRKGE